MAKGAYIGVNGVARKIKKGYVGVENFTKRNLPAGYTQVEYIESTGSQYFDTGVIGKTGITAEVEFEYTTVDSVNNILGSKNGDIRIYIPHYNAGFYFGYGAATKTNVTASAGTRYTIKTSLLSGSQSMNINGKQVYTGTSTTTYNSNLSMYLMAMNESGSANYFAKGRTFASTIKENGTLIRDYVPCVNASGTVGLYDMVNCTFGGDAAGVGFVAGPTYKGVARKIVKAYVGIGGVARPCWSGGELAYYGTVTALNTAVYEHGAASNANYAIFAGGHTVSGFTSIVNAYSKTLTRSIPTSLTVVAREAAGTQIGNYAVLAGGYGGGYSANVDAYDLSLTKKTASFSTAVGGQKAAPIGSYGLFAGGAKSDGVTNLVFSCNTSLTTSVASSLLSSATSGHAAASNGSYALFAGGYASKAMATVNAYNASLTRKTATVMSAARYGLAAASVGDYALFGGGHDFSSLKNVVDAYNKSLTRTVLTPLSEAKYNLAATSLPGYAIFAGGLNSNGYQRATADAYDESLTKTVQGDMSLGRDYFVASSVGDYALFAGGRHGEGCVTNVDAYTVA